jgi:mannose-6-phosphate isomerase-like protein (cupin superfamily)
MGSYQSFTLEDLDKAQASNGRPYSEVLRREGFSMGTYRLGVGGEDGQHPHRADEVYLVMRGRAGLEVEGQRLDVEAGSIVSVDRGADHHFVDITDDLQVVVIFAPPETPDD